MRHTQTIEHRHNLNKASRTLQAEGGGSEGGRGNFRGNCLGHYKYRSPSGEGSQEATPSLLQGRSIQSFY